jgi:hypothetical protein
MQIIPNIFWYLSDLFASVVFKYYHIKKLKNLCWNAIRYYTTPSFATLLCLDGENIWSDE